MNVTVRDLFFHFRVVEDGSLWQECVRFFTALLTVWTATVELEISLSETQLAHIVDNTFMDADLDHNGVIDLNEYQVRLAVTLLRSCARDRQCGCLTY